MDGTALERDTPWADWDSCYFYVEEGKKAVRNCRKLSATHAAACTWRWLRKCPLLGGGKLFPTWWRHYSYGGWRWPTVKFVLGCSHCSAVASTSVSVKSLTGLCQNKTGQSELKMWNLGGNLSVSALEHLFAFARWQTVTGWCVCEKVRPWWMNVLVHVCVCEDNGASLKERPNESSGHCYFPHQWFAVPCNSAFWGIFNL